MTHIKASFMCIPFCPLAAPLLTCKLLIFSSALGNLWDVFKTKSVCQDTQVICLMVRCQELMYY